MKNRSMKVRTGNNPYPSIPHMIKKIPPHSYSNSDNVRPPVTSKSAARAQPSSEEPPEVKREPDHPMTTGWFSWNFHVKTTYPLIMEVLIGISLVNGGVSWKIIDKWSLFHCHVWLPEGSFSDRRDNLDRRKKVFVSHGMVLLNYSAKMIMTRKWSCQ